MDISVIIPVYNEEENLWILYKELKPTLDPIGKNYEIIFIDDKSTDASLSILKEISRIDDNVKVICFDKNYGKTSALDAGFRYANGNYVLTIDADLQIKPVELVSVYRELKNCDAIIGWRRNRIKADGLIKTVSSIIANFIRNLVLKEKFHDSGCSLKGFRSTVKKDLVIYDEFEYFIFSLLKIDNRRIKEVSIETYPRIYGKSKHNTRNRILKLLIPLLIVRCLQKNRLRYKVTEFI